MATVIVLDEALTSTQQGAGFGIRISQRTERILFGSAFIPALFAAWELVTVLGVEPPIVLPSPQGVIGAFGTLFSSPDVWADFAASGAELLYGFALAAAVGIAAGLLIGWYPRLGYFFDPFINFLYACLALPLGRSWSSGSGSG